MAEAAPVKFYSNPICPFAHRAWWALKEKEVPHEFIHIPLGGEKPEWFTATINPRGTVPVLQQDGHTVFESLIIAEFVEDAYADKSPKLMPTDPFQRAAIRLFIDQFGQSIGPLYALLKNQDREKDEELKAQLNTKLQAVADMLKANSEGPYFLGGELSIADIAVVPFLERFSATLPHYRNFDPLAVDERLAKWLEACRSRPAFRETTREPEFFVEGYKTYALPQN